jgi:tricorn protease
VSNRAEFNDLAGYMVGSLSSGHTSIARPFSEGVPARAVARLGASFGDRNGAVVLEIFDGDLDITDERSPLTQVSPPIEVLDRVTHFNGATVRSVDSLERMLVGKVGERVMLTVEKPDGTQREHWVTAISAADEAWLRGKAWAAGNARAAAAMSDGRVGYIHLASAYADDFGDFMAQYGSLHDREGLILDLRGNNGGNIDPWVLNLLQRRTWLYVKDRHDQFPLEHPRDSFSGRLVVLIDGDTYSDGELIAEGVRQLGLGLLVGTRTTGAGIWVNDDRRLIDGGRVRIPVSSSFLPGDPETRLVIEGHGIAPDTVVENDPYLFFHGHDAQLEHAVALALEDAVGAQ